MIYEIKRYEINIKGTSPIIWNVMKKEIETEKKELKKNELNEWEEKNYLKKAEYNDKNKVIIPERWIKGLIENAAKRTRLVPHFATRKNETYTLYTSSFMIYGNHEGHNTKNITPYGAFVGAQGANSTTKVWRIRPMLNEWDYSFKIIDPAGRMKLEELKALLEYAGLFIGLGDNRKNNYGRYEITKIIEVKK